MSEPTAPGGGDRLGRTLEVLGKVVAPTTLATALLVYFGWARTSATYAAFGIDRAVLEFPVQEYLFRSVAGTFTPAAALLLTFLVVVPAHALLVHLLTRWSARTAAIAAIAVALIGVIATTLGVLGFTELLVYRIAWPVVPALLGCGVLLLWYAPTLYRIASGRPVPFLGERTPIHDAWRMVFGCFLVLTLFWAVAFYGQVTGIQEAQRIAQEPRTLPGTVVYTSQSLRLDGAGIVETRLPSEGQYRFRYDGLRLLVRGPHRYVLLPASWRPGARAVVLSDDPSIRIEFFLGARPRP